MTALNGCEPRKIAVQGPYAFTVGDLSGFPAYEREGIVRQVKVPRKIPFHSSAPPPATIHRTALCKVTAWA